MGAEIDREVFSAADHARFSARLEQNLVALRALLERPGFGEGPTTIGAEVELHLVNAAGRPIPDNVAILADASDPCLTAEIDRFNIEINVQPHRLAGRPFSALARSIAAELAVVRAAAARRAASPALIGILPTLEESDLGPAALTDTHRYRAMSTAIRRLHGARFPLHIAGEDTLDLSAPDVTFEGANASFQVHLRVAPCAFARTYNAAQVAAGPALALAGNSPFLLGRRLWDETRVALFRQAVDDRPGATGDDWRPARVSFGHGWVRASAAELFAQAVALHHPILPVVSTDAATAQDDPPALSELRLHTGTVWQWNRAIYDPTAGGHLRIEFRALPAGPSLVDMVAGGAFFLGLVLALSPIVDEFLAGFLFGHARRNFYEAARRGLGAALLWPERLGRAPVPRPAADLVAELADTSVRGLIEAGVERSEASRWLDIVSARARAGVSGARWQDLVFRDEARRLPRSAALSAMFARYRRESDGGRPVHEWSLP